MCVFHSFARSLPILRMLPDPTDISLKASTSLSALASNSEGSSKKMKLSRRSASGTALSSTCRHTIGANRLFSDAACATSFSATSDFTELGESTNTTVSDRPINAWIRFHQSSNA